MQPAAEPRPGPTRIPFLFAHMMKSATTRKYEQKPIWVMMPISYSTCWRRRSS